MSSRTTLTRVSQANLFDYFVLFLFIVLKKRKAGSALVYSPIKVMLAATVPRDWLYTSLFLGSKSQRKIHIVDFASIGYQSAKIQSISTMLLLARVQKAYGSKDPFQYTPQY